MKYPKLPEEFDDRKKLTIRYMIECLKDYGLKQSEIARIFGVSRSLITKLKLTPKEARDKRYKYQKGCGNTKKYRQKTKKILKDKILKYRRDWRKNNRIRKNKYTPRLSIRKYNKTNQWKS